MSYMWMEGWIKPKKALRRTVLIPVRLEVEAVKKLDMLAIKENKYRSELIREGMKDLIKKYEFYEKNPRIDRRDD